MNFRTAFWIRATIAVFVFNVLFMFTDTTLFQTASAAQSDPNIIFILDGSASMWGELESEKKIVIAKKRMTELVEGLEGVNMGLIVYGHRRKADCNDIEIMVPLQSGNQSEVIAKIQAVSPKGKTPITGSIELATRQLETIEEETAIVLVSDGIETCQGDPCVYVKTLKDKGIKFKMDVVGFDVNDQERHQLECIAQAGGGIYFNAQNAIQLKDALTEVKKEVVQHVKKVRHPDPGLKLNAVAEENGEPLKGKLAWCVYKAGKDMYGNREWVTASDESAPLFKLSTGRYFITVQNESYRVSQEVNVDADQRQEINLALKTGPVTPLPTVQQTEAVTPAEPEPAISAEPGLKMNAVLKEGAPPITDNIRWYVHDAQTDINGKRKYITETNTAEPLFKLNQGRYYITAKHGNATASVEVDVAAGEQKQVTMNLNAGYLKWRAVLKEGAAPITDNIRWYVHDAQTDINGKRKYITETNTAEPLFRLNRGRYYITAKHGSATASVEVDVAAGEQKQVTLNMNAGYLKWRAVLKEGAAPITDNIRWYVYDAQTDINGKRKYITETPTAEPLFELNQGRYYITAKHGSATVSVEVDVAAGEQKQVTMNLNAGYLKWRAVLKEGNSAITDNISWYVHDAQTDINGKRKYITETGTAEPLFKLNQGRYYITAKHGNATAAMEVDVAAGEQKQVTLNLNAANSGPIPASQTAPQAAGPKVESMAGASEPGLKLRALLSDGGVPVIENMYWRIYEAQQDINGNRKEIAHASEAEPLFNLNPGRYYITATHDNAFAAMEMDIAAGELKQVTINLKAGYLKLQACLKNGAPPINESLYWQVYEAQQDINGNRKEIAHASGADPLFRLNQGRYYVTVNHDNAVAAMEMDIAAGDQKQVMVDLKAGYLKLQACLKNGTPPVNESLYWQVYEAQQDINGNRKEIAHASGAAPLFRLNQGRYYVAVNHDNAFAATEMDITAGDQKQIVVDLKAGYLKLQACLKNGTPPVTESLYWQVYEAQLDINGNRKEIAHASGADPLFRLNQGRYYVAVNHDNAVAAMEMEIAAGEQKQVMVDLKAGYLKLQACLENGGPSVTDGLYWQVYDAQQDINGNRKEIGHSGDAAPLFRLNQGHYYITAKHGEATAALEVDITTGEQKQVMLDFSRTP